MKIKLLKDPYFYVGFILITLSIPLLSNDNFNPGKVGVYGVVSQNVFEGDNCSPVVDYTINEFIYKNKTQNSSRYFCSLIPGDKVLVYADKENQYNITLNEDGLSILKIFAYIFIFFGLLMVINSIYQNKKRNK